MDGGNPHRNFTSWKPQLPSSLGMPHSLIFRSDMIFHYLGEKYLLRLMSFRYQLYGNICWISNYMEIWWKSYGIWKPYEHIWKHEELMLHNCTNMMLKCQPATVIPLWPNVVGPWRLDSRWPGFFQGSSRKGSNMESQTSETENCRPGVVSKKYHPTWRLGNLDSGENIQIWTSNVSLEISAAPCRSRSGPEFGSATKPRTWKPWCKDGPGDAQHVNLWMRWMNTSQAQHLGSHGICRRPWVAMGSHVLAKSPGRKGFGMDQEILGRILNTQTII